MEENAPDEAGFISWDKVEKPLQSTKISGDITVGQLIEHLSKFNKDAKVQAHWDGSVSDNHIVGIKEDRNGNVTIKIV